MKNKLKRKFEKGQKAKAIKEAVRRVSKGGRAWKDKGLKMGWKDWSVDSVKKADAKDLPAIKILRERKITMCEIDLDIPDEVSDQMYKYGISHIHKDRKAIINWTFNLALKNSVEMLKKSSEKIFKKK